MVKDLEFIQLLGNPKYIIELVNRGYFYNQDFINYLHQLKQTFYKLESEFLHLIKYPEGLLNL